MSKLEEVQPIPPDPGEEEYAERQEAETQPDPDQELIEKKQSKEPAKSEAATIDPPAKSKPLKKKKAVNFPHAFTRFYNDEHESEAGKPSQFFKYWKRVCSDPDLRQRAVAYLYRVWPALLDGKRQVAKVYDSPMTAEDILRQYGCGDYIIRLNDSGSRGMNITNCKLTNLGGRQLNDFPPVLNPDDLDFDDKSNQSYLLWARSRGILKPEQESKIRAGETGNDRKKEGEEEMANAEAVKQLASTVDRIVDRAMTKQSNDSSGGLPEKLLDLITAASASATSSAAQIMQESVKQVLELQKQNANPLQNLKEVAGTLKDLLPSQAAGESVITKLIEQDKRYTETIFQIQNERIAGLEKLVEKLTSAQLAAIQNPSAAPAAAQTSLEKPKSAIESLRELAQVKDELREILGLEDKEEPGWMKYAPLLAQGISMLGVYLANTMHNLAVAKTGTGTPQPPPAPQEAQQAAQQNQATAPMAQQTISEEQQDGMKQFHLFLQRIERPLLLSFNEGETGAEFAAKLIELTDNGMFGPNISGRQVYDSLLEYGKDVVATLIKTYPPIWTAVGQTPQKWEKFLDEFFRADEIWAQQDAEQTDPMPPGGGQRKKKAA